MTRRRRGSIVSWHYPDGRVIRIKDMEAREVQDILYNLKKDWENRSGNSRNMWIHTLRAIKKFERELARKTFI